MIVTNNLLKLKIMWLSHFDFCVIIHRKEFIKLTPTLLIIGALVYFSRRLSTGARGQGVSTYSIVL